MRAPAEARLLLPSDLFPFLDAAKTMQAEFLSGGVWDRAVATWNKELRQQDLVERYSVDQIKTNSLSRTLDYLGKWAQFRHGLRTWGRNATTLQLALIPREDWLDGQIAYDGSDLLFLRHRSTHLPLWTDIRVRAQEVRDLILHNVPRTKDGQLLSGAKRGPKRKYGDTARRTIAAVVLLKADQIGADALREYSLVQLEKEIRGEKFAQRLALPRKTILRRWLRADITRIVGERQ